MPYFHQLAISFLHEMPYFHQLAKSFSAKCHIFTNLQKVFSAKCHIFTNLQKVFTCEQRKCLNIRYTVERQIFEAHNFRGSCNLKRFVETIFADQGNPASHAFFLRLFAAPNFRGSRPIREKRENYAPRKFGAIRYLSTVY